MGRAFTPEERAQMRTNCATKILEGPAEGELGFYNSSPIPYTVRRPSPGLHRDMFPSRLSAFSVQWSQDVYNRLYISKLYIWVSFNTRLFIKTVFLLRVNLMEEFGEESTLTMAFFIRIFPRCWIMSTRMHDLSGRGRAQQMDWTSSDSPARGLQFF